MLNTLTATPLLLLLDGTHSGRHDQIQQAMEQIEKIISSSSNLSNSSIEGTISSSTNASSFYQLPTSLGEIVEELLTVAPDMASIVSSHDGSFPLHFASSIGEVGVVSSIFSRYPAAPSKPNHKGKLPLHYASREGREDVVLFLLRVDPKTASYKTDNLKLPLHYSVGDGHRSISQHLLRAYPDGVRAISAKGKLPLHFASRWGHLDIVNDLLEAFPRGVQCLDWEELLPLHDASRQDQKIVAARLIEVYPDGLRTETIRGELPLLTAVRNSSVELVAQLVYALPEAARLMLQSLIEEDNVEEWDWDIIELCLRGAMNMLKRVDVIKKRFPDIIISCHENKAPVLKFEPYQQQLKPFQVKNCSSTTDDSTHSSDANADSTAESSSTVQCKRPCLGPDRNKNSGKQCTHPSLSDDEKTHINNNNHPNTNPSTSLFLALHAAIENRCNLLIMKRVFDRHADQAFIKNSSGMLPLHVASCYTRSDHKTKDVIQNLLSINPNGATVRDVWGRLPLHVALRNRAEYAVVKCLLDANKVAGFQHCLTGDVFRETLPVYMAAYFDCDVNVTYLLLRGDPGVVHYFNPIQS